MKAQDRIVGAALWAAFGGAAVLFASVLAFVVLLLIGRDEFQHGIGYAGLMVVLLIALTLLIRAWALGLPLPSYEHPFAPPDELWRKTDG